MKRVLAVLTLGTLGALPVALAGCGASSTFFNIDGVEAIGGGSCVVQPTLQMAQSSGIFDVAQGASTAPYYLGVVVSDSTSAASGGQNVSTDPNNINITGFTATFSALGSTALPSAFGAGTSRPLAGPVVTAGGGTAGVGFQLMTQAQVAALVGVVTPTAPLDLQANVTVTGRFLSGDGINTQSISFPIHVCSGCLIQDGGKCPVSGTPETGDSCNPAQDRPVTCCHVNTCTNAASCASTCVQGPLVCPASSTVSPC
jgi:hypothetical protein